MNVNVTPIEVTNGPTAGKMTIVEMRALSRYVFALPDDAPELTEGKTFELGGKAWRLVVNVAEG